MEKSCINLKGLANYESQIIEICCEKKGEARQEFVEKFGACMREKYCGEICVERLNCEC